MKDEMSKKEEKLLIKSLEPKEALKWCKQYEKDFLKKHGYTMDEMIQAENEIQASKEENKLRCTKCTHRRLISQKDYLDIQNGKKVVFTCNMCGAEMKYKC